MNYDFDVFVTKEQILKWTAKALDKELDLSSAQWGVFEEHDGPHGTIRVRYKAIEVLGD